MEQLRLIPARDPDDLIDEAKRAWAPIHTFCLFSGGNDSAVAAHRCRAHYEELLFIDTGVAAPGVEDFVREYAEWLGKKLRIMRAGDAYRQLVLENGFPGRAAHAKAYSRLKERQLEAVLRDTKRGHPHTSSVLFISGLRRAESSRRAGRMPLTDRWSAKFVNPLTDWTAVDIRGYRTRHGLPESDVAALLHRSGECNCGAFGGASGERAMLAGLWPEWWARTIEPLEREAEAAGLRWCRWGGLDIAGTQAAGHARAGGTLCSDCLAGQEVLFGSRDN